jgi:hypothetical protein
MISAPSCEEKRLVLASRLHPGQAVFLSQGTPWLFAICVCCVLGQSAVPADQRRNVTGTVCVSCSVVRSGTPRSREKGAGARNSCCSAFHSSIVQGAQAGVNPKVFAGTASILLEAHERVVRA